MWSNSLIYSAQNQRIASCTWYYAVSSIQAHVQKIHDNIHYCSVISTSILHFYFFILYQLPTYHLIIFSTLIHIFFHQFNQQVYSGFHQDAVSAPKLTSI